jgi:predicted RNA binding protein YcfA (HicA-like mRNA interferase family)
MAELHRRLAAILRENGCTQIRAGKGSHEIWFSPVNGRHVTVPRSTKSRHSANEVLKQAGLPKAF